MKPVSSVLKFGWGHQVVPRVRHSCPALTGSQPHDHHGQTHTPVYTRSARRREHTARALKCLSRLISALQ